MTFPKLLLPILAAACLGGCVYEEYETGYRQPPRVYHGGYVRRDVVVARPARYYDDRPNVYAYDDEPYYEERPRVYYDRRPQPRYIYAQPRPIVSPVIVHRGHRGDHCESPDERRRREIREAQRRERERDKRKDDRKKNDRKKDDDDRKKRKRGD